MSGQGPIRILVVEDEASMCKLLKRELALPGRQVTTVMSALEARAIVAEQDFDVIVLDVRLPDGHGLELLERFREALANVEVIMITGYSEVAVAVEAMRMGAYDYILKPFSLERMNLVIEKAHQRGMLQKEIRLLRKSKADFVLPVAIGNSVAMQRVQYLVDKVASTGTPVLITGKSGVGKNVIVSQLHAKSTRANNPLVIKNCGAFNKELLRSELFGHRKGAFTGAVESRDGLLALANNSSLFFDEVGELSLEVQALLLRVLESQKYRRVGEKEEREVDVRFFFATNRDLAKEVEEGRFHEALFHRINVFCIDIPPLRERKEDIPALLEYFLQYLYPDRPTYKISQQAIQCLMAYDWPGNVRELRNVLERGVILAENDLITPQHLPADIAKYLDNSDSCTPFPSLQKQEIQYIMRVLEYVGGNKTKASEILGINRKTLFRKLRFYNLLNVNRH